MHWNVCVWEQEDHFDAFGVKLVGFLVARGIVQFQNLKRLSFIGKVVYNLGQSINGTNLEKVLLLSTSCTINKRLVACFHFFFFF